MQKKNPKTRCEKKSLSKSDGICRFYSKIQSVYADQLEQDELITEIHCNYMLDGLDIGEYKLQDNHEHFLSNNYAHFLQGSGIFF